MTLLAELRAHPTPRPERLARIIAGQIEPLLNWGVGTFIVGLGVTIVATGGTLVVDRVYDLRSPAWLFLLVIAAVTVLGTWPFVRSWRRKRDAVLLLGRYGALGELEITRRHGESARQVRLRYEGIELEWSFRGFREIEGTHPVLFHVGSSAALYFAPGVRWLDTSKVTQALPSARLTSR